LGPSLLNLNHYNNAASRVAPGNAAFLATYNAESGASSFLAGSFTCTNVSCHGGQATPNWRTGAIDPNTQCTSCHAQGTAQYNSYDSGEHDKHVNDEGLSCTQCHNTATLAGNHFTTLSTPAMEGPASATVGGGTTNVVTYNAGSCTPTSGTGCHGARNW
jgi:predicted CxxxxCH...CXXCH cytochrome family protein